MASIPTTIPRYERARELATVFIVVAIVSGLSLFFTRLTEHGVATLWLANGIVTGILLTRPTGRWPALLVTALAAQAAVRVTGNNPFDLELIALAANALEILVVAGVVRSRFDDVADSTRWLKLGRTSISAAAVACIASGFIVAGSAALLYGADFAGVLITWFGSHLIGMAVMATYVIVARRVGADVIGRSGHRLSFALNQALVAACAIGIFTQSSYPLLFLAYPPLLLAAFRHQFPGAIMGIAVLAVVATVATSHGMGPFTLVRDIGPVENAFLLQVFVGAACLMTFPVSLALGEREVFQRRVAESEAHYRMLADNVHDMVVRMRNDGQRTYVSPSVKALLGWEAEYLMSSRWEIMHPDDREMIYEFLGMLATDGTPSQVIYRAKHADGHWVWIEAIARRVPGEDPAGPMDVLYSARDVSERVNAELIAGATQVRLERVTDNIPALISHMDRDQRYTFANAAHRPVFGLSPAEIVGRSVHQVIGDEAYGGVAQHMATALRGEAVSFASETTLRGKTTHFQANYVPDFAPDGSVQGFFALTFDITKMKEAEEALALLARVDSLTGLANRRQFDERLALGLARAQRQRLPIVLMYLDIDHFKRVNDTLGHAAGDEVIQVFASRLASVVREGDLVARFGGDEFVVLIEDAATPAVAERIAAKLIARMGEGIAVGGTSLPVTTSIGIAYASKAPDAETLMAAADGALYKAKAAGRNCFRMVECPAGERAA